MMCYRDYMHTVCSRYIAVFENLTIREYNTRVKMVTYCFRRLSERLDKSGTFSILSTSSFLLTCSLLWTSSFVRTSSFTLTSSFFMSSSFLTSSFLVMMPCFTSLLKRELMSSALGSSVGVAREAPAGGANAPEVPTMRWEQRLLNVSCHLLPVSMDKVDKTAGFS